ncbi:MAG: hypothetical protein H6901_09935 [Rhodobacteraceae bacterium]|nr:hypothetical protein [Paracoccaceae bacterium]MCP5342522.1 hypothetical protein [Paracoccaceae bacterium]
MKTFILVTRVVAWLMLAFVGIKLAAASYLNYDAGMPIGSAIGSVFKGFLVSSEPRDRVYFYAIVLGLAFLYKARFLSKLNKSAEDDQ